MRKLVPIIMGSEGDVEFCKKIIPSIEKFDIKYEIRIASVNKHSEYLLDMVREYDGKKNTLIVYVAVAGRQHALAPTLAANTTNPVIACYPDNKANEDILSSLHTPTGVTIYPVLYPETVGLSIAKIMSLSNPVLKIEVSNYLEALKNSIEESDKRLRG